MDRQESSLSWPRWQLAGLRVQAAMLRLSVVLKAGFRPDQPRVPRGRPDGGQWTRMPGYAQVHPSLAPQGRRRADQDWRALASDHARI